MKSACLASLLLVLLCHLPLVGQDHISALEDKIERLPDSREKVESLVELGSMLQASKPRQSIRAYEKAIDLGATIGHAPGITSAKYGLAITYFTSGRTNRGIETLEEHLPQLEQAGNTEQLQRFYLLLAQMNGKKKDLVGLRKYQKLYVQLQDSLIQARAAEEISIIEEKYREEKTIATEAVQQKDQALSDLREQEAINLRKQLEIARLQTQTAELERANAEKEQDRLAKVNEAIQLEIELSEKIQNRNRLIYFGAALLVFAGFLLQRYRILQQRKRVEFEQQKSERLEQIDRLKDQFLANTSHELKTPLNGIIGIAEGLYDGVHDSDPAQRKSNLGMIITSGKRLSNLVNDLLDFSKIRNDELHLNLRPVDMRSIAEVVLVMSKSLAEAKGIELQNKVPGNLSAVHGDEDRLQQILFNLVDNAIKFSKGGVVQVRAEQADGKVTVTVDDEGMGIPPDQIETVFDDFTQIDGGLNRSYGGAGLGLSITKNLVVLHGGEVNVSSQLDKGSSFSFSIPISAEKPPASGLKTDLARLLSLGASSPEPMATSPAPEQKVAAADDQKVSILIVDDEPINQQVLRNHLSETHYEISTAMDGAEAMRLVENGQKFDLVLLDIMMPGMTGYTVCQQIRKKYLASELPIIMITAKNQVSDLVEALSYGANDYLAKPFSKDEFLARIKTHLDLYAINSATTRFVPSEFLRSLGYETITDVRLGDHQERDVTVFFSDIRSYTTMSESMSPEQNFKFVAAYVNRMGPIIKRFDGFVLQYLGDGIMALFLDSPDKAVQASVAMQRRIYQYNQERVALGREPISVGMGLHTGPLVMGIIGDSSRNDPTTISDAVNVASRMEGLTRRFGAKVLVTRSTIDRMAEAGEVSHRYLGKVETKGKKELVEVYEILDAEEEDRRATKMATRTQFEAGVKAFIQRDYAAALQAFKAVLQQDEHDLATIYYVKEAQAYLDVPV